MCRICTEIQMGRMSVSDGRMALIEMRSTLTKEHIDIIEKMLDTRRKMEADTKSIVGASGVESADIHIDIDKWFPLSGYLD